MPFNTFESGALRETYTGFTHPSGMGVYLFPKKGFAKAYAVVGVRCGSVDNRLDLNGESVKVPDGIAHFLEHKLFESQEGNAFERYAKTGASANAYTSFDKTAYLFSTTGEFEESLEILLSMMRTPYFTEENVEKEKGIIAQEIRMYEDDPGWRVFFNLLRAVYEKHPVRIDIAGTVESIAGIDKDLLYRCYNAFYNPANTVLCVVGDVEMESVLKIVDRYYQEKDGGKRLVRAGVDEPARLASPYIEQRLPVAMPLFYIGFKDNQASYGGKEGARRAALTDILLEMLCGEGSEFYARLYADGLINQSFGAEYESGANFALSVLRGESRDPKRVKEELIGEIRKFPGRFDERLFDVCKKVVYTRAVRAFNSVEGIANSFISCYFNGMDFFDTVEVFGEITPEDAIKRFQEHFNDRTMALSVVLP